MGYGCRCKERGDDMYCRGAGRTRTCTHTRNFHVPARPEKQAVCNMHWDLSKFCHHSVCTKVSFLLNAICPLTPHARRLPTSRAGVDSHTPDPVESDVHNWGYQACQPWQDEVISRAERGPLAKLREAVAARAAGGSGAGAAANGGALR